MAMIAGIRIGLFVWAVAGPALAVGVTWTAMSIREEIVSSAKVRAARDFSRIECNSRVATLSREHDRVVDAITDEAEAAANATTTPQSVPEIQALCDRSASCRDRRPRP